MAKSQIPKGKKILLVYIRKEIDKSFREFIAQKYGKYKGGLLSFETEQAIQAYVAEHKFAQANGIVVPVNPTPKLFMVREQVKEVLKENFAYEVIYKVPLVHLKKAIGLVRGTDHRTIRKWVRLFKKFKIIKFLSNNLVEFL